jgi:hypothetical protein
MAPGGRGVTGAATGGTVSGEGCGFVDVAALMMAPTSTTPANHHQPPAKPRFGVAVTVGPAGF